MKLFFEGVLGLEKSYSKSCAGKYRYGYQGKFAEKDEETGWEHFELREYDPIIGRMTTTDPYGQYWSSYIGIGNDPINSTDSDGGFTGYERKDDGSLRKVNNVGGDRFDVIYNHDGTIEQIFLSAITVSAGMSNSMISATKLGIYQGQEDFMNHPVTQGAMFGLGFFTGGSEAFLLGRLGAAATRFAKPISQLSSPLAKASSNVLGKIGESAVGAVDKIKTVIRVNGRDRIPDGLTKKVLTEVKNVGELSFTRQLRDFHKYAKSKGLDFDLYVRPSTNLSKSLQNAVNSGDINLKFIPGVH